MKSHEQRVADAVASLTARLDSWGVADAPAKAHEFVRDMLTNGWRTTRWDLDMPPKSWQPGDARTHADQIRARMGWTRTEGDAR